MRGESIKENFKAKREQYVPVWASKRGVGNPLQHCFWGEDKWHHPGGNGH